jgi:hypothetical protein
MNRHAQNKRRKGYPHKMTTPESNITDKATTVAAQGAHVAPDKTAAKKAASQKKDMPKGQKTAKGAMDNFAPLQKTPSLSEP